MVSGKSIVVTGAASGIGRACARRLLDDGNRIVAVDLDRGSLEKNFGPETGELQYFAGDVARTATADGAAAVALDAFGGIDGLAHFAAAHSKLNWERADEDEFNRIMSINVTGPFLMAKACAKVMGVLRGSIRSLVKTKSCYGGGKCAL